MLGQALTMKAGFILRGLNVFMERVVLPFKVRREEGPNYKERLHDVKLNAVLEKHEIEALNNPFLSDAEKAEIVVLGIRRNFVIPGRRLLLEVNDG